MRKPRPAASAIYLDANVFIYLVDGDQATSAAVLPLFEALRNKPGVGVTSEISLAEVLAGRDARTRRLYMDLMVFGQFLTLVPVDRDVLYDTADLRKVAKMKLVDAIHLATAIRTRCRYFVTRDGDFRRMPRGMTKIGARCDGHRRPCHEGLVMTDAPLLSVRNLGVVFRQGGVETMAVEGATFDIAKGETMALVGESGSGKSVTALSVMRLLPASAIHPAGEIHFKGKDLLTASDKELRAVRGNDIGIIFQEPMTSLNPLHTVERQVGEVMKVHRGLHETAARARTLELLAAGRHPRRREPAWRLSAPAFRRPAPARDDRHGARQRARPPDRRRADDGARRDRAGANPEASRRPAEADGVGAPVHHPRPRHRAALCRQGVRDDRRPHRRAGTHGGHLHQSAARLYPPPAGGRAEGRSAASGRERAGGDGGRQAESVVPDPARFPQAHGRVHQGGGRHRRDGQAWADAGRGRRIRLGQDDAGPGADAADLVRGAHRLSRPGNRRPHLQGDAAAEARHADRLPGPLRLAQPTHVDCRHRRRGAEAARRQSLGQRARQARRRGAGGGRPRCRDAQPLPARILGRPAPAHRGRPRHGAGAGIRHARRADLGARHERAGAGGRSPARAAAPARPRLSVHQPRPESGAGAGQRHSGDARRRGGGTGPRDGGLRQSQDRLHHAR